jgi:Coenzyme PQQ synthesis protein D (PqqD)
VHRGENEKPDSLSDVAALFRKKGEFVIRSIAGETIIVPVRGQVGDLDSIYNLNEAGAFIWERIDGRTSVTQVVEALRGQFEVALEQAEKETSEFIAALEAAGMIEPSRPES